MRVGSRQLLWLVLLGLLPFGAGPARAQYDPAKEYDFKAAYLYKFALLTQWAPAAFADTNAPFVIGILGSDPWRGELAKKVRASVKERKLVVKVCASADEAKQCHLLFISKSEKDRLAQVLEQLKETNIFTVVESERTTETDAVINLYVDNSLKFTLNEDAEERDKLTKGSELKEAETKRFRKKKI